MPKNKHEIRSFVGLCMYYRRFISGFANIAKPLAKLSKEKQAVQWTPEMEAKESVPTATKLRCGQTLSR
jgi:hypothetical protein